MGPSKRNDGSVSVLRVVARVRGPLVLRYWEVLWY